MIEDPVQISRFQRGSQRRGPKIARAPRTADGKPDLTGVWMHEPTTVAEIKQLFGHQFDDDIKTNGPGMEIGTQHKYGFNILVDFKDANGPGRPDIYMSKSLRP